MRNTVSFPLPADADFWDDPSVIQTPDVPGIRALPRVDRVPRQGAVLHPSPVAGHDDVFSLNLTRGCVHRCAFCSVRAHADYAGDRVVYLFGDTAERLDAELSRMRKRPRAVFISPSTDPFPPFADIQMETARVVEVLAAHGISAWLMTRGYIRPTPLRLLAANAERVKVTVGLTTLDRAMQRVLEPLAAPPRLRLRQIRQLRELRIAIQVAMEPLVPGLTDTRVNLAAVLEALAAAGVRRVLASYLFLRSGIRDHLLRALEPLGLAEPVLGAFTGGPILSAGRIEAARYLPKVRRQRGYAALMALAAGLGMTVSVSGTTNPDFQASRQTGADTGSAPLGFLRFAGASSPAAASAQPRPVVA